MRRGGGERVIAEALHRVNRFLPQGNQLPDRDWRARHRVMLIILLAHTVGLFVFGLLVGYEPTRTLLYVTPVGLCAALAASPSINRRARSCLATTGAMVSSAVLVQLSGGLIEAHFHFFVMLSVITMYYDWLTFLLAAAFVVIEHAVVGVLTPASVYSHSSPQHPPVRFAVVHAVFVAGAAAAGVANWRLTENAQAAERKIAEQLAYEAGHDSLTGALNRREFDRRLAQRLARPRRAGTDAPAVYDALCYLDLDRFKIVNDSCGHAAGDQLLVQLTGLIRGEMGEHDLLARVGGDEFVVLLLDCDLERAAEFAERARTAVAAHRFAVGGRVFDVGMSVGVVPVSMGSGVTTAQEAVRAADAACYAANDKGRNRIHVVALDDNELTRQRGEVRWAERLMSAMQDDSLQLYYQPIAPIVTVPGVQRFGELLLRMRDDDGNVIGPGAFLAAAERYDLVAAVDRWVVDAALAALAGRYRGVRAGDRLELFSINLSGGSIGDESFLAYVRSKLAEYEVPPHVICFEITETVAITDLTAAFGFIAELRALGCRFALDDFGSGLSSFTYLKKLPVDVVKIDGNFVREITTDPVDRAMVESVNRISHEMGLRTVAEFVETEAIMQCLRRLGVDFAQGYGVARPEPFAGWLAAHPPARTRRRLVTVEAGVANVS
jgi:diguanylate cyclase (GGDEF)-like protein